MKGWHRFYIDCVLILKISIFKVSIFLFQSKKAEIENGDASFNPADASFNPADETVEVKTKPDKPPAKKVQQPKMVNMFSFPTVVSSLWTHDIVI